MIAWAVEALIASAVLMLVVLLVRAPVRRLVGAQVAYALWALPVLRMVMPPLPAMWREQVAMPIARASEAVSVLMVPYDGPALTGASEPVAALPWGAMVAAAWAMGALAFFVYHFVRHQSFCRRLLRDARTLDEIGGVRVIETAAAAGPLAFGTARRFVAFPCDFADRYDADERALALAHELGHHARGDLIANWAALALLAVHWFNPLAWRAFRAFRCDQELANDARVLAGRSRTDRHIYACAIVKAAHGGAIAATCHLHTIADLKGRLKMLTISRPSRTRLAAGGAAVLGLVAGGLIVTASGTEAAAAITARVESATGVQIVAPAVPEAPAVPSAPAVPTRKVTRGVVVIENGKTTTYEGAAAARYIAAHPVSLPPVPPVPPVPPRPATGIVPPAPPVPPMPVPVDANVQVTVRNGDCQPSSGGDTVIRETRNGQRVMVVCQNRIRAQVMSAERQASVAVRQAAMAERQAAFAERRASTAKISGLQQAVASIRGARFSIENNRNLTDEQRKVALAGLDDAMAELRSEMQD